MTKRPFFLLVNDDGINSKGIYYLYQSLKDFADLLICAPATQQSGVGVAFSYNKSFLLEKVDFDGDQIAWQVHGTPADCTKIALNELTNRRPDLIISGINHGENCGRAVLYSGTIGAIIEGTNKHVPGIAFSYYDKDVDDFEHVVEYIPNIVNHVLKHPMPEKTFLNVNFPSKSIPFQGMKFARQGNAYWIDCAEKQPHPEEKLEYLIHGKPIVYDEHDESDVMYLSKGYITAVPLNIVDLTDHDHYLDHKDLFESALNTVSVKNT